MRMGGREAANDGIDTRGPVGLGLLRSVERLCLILGSLCVEKKAMERELGGKDGRTESRAGENSKAISLVE